ncbi:MAG: GntR family transcriptional regulator [Desulfobacterales bacterium]
MKIVDPSNPIPKYLQISAWLRDLIQAGRLMDGEKLPSEIELSKMCGVNRNTLRQAISELTAQGLVRKERGMGNFVTVNRPEAFKHKLERISSFRDDLGEIGIAEKTTLLNKGLVLAPETVAKSLILRPKGNVVEIQRLRSGNGIPLVYEESYLPGEMFKSILDMDLTGSMYKLISEQFNTVLNRCEQCIRAVNLNGKIAGLFKLPKNSAGLYMESITYNDHNVPIEVLYSYYRGDKYIFEIELGSYQIKENNLPSLTV